MNSLKLRLGFVAIPGFLLQLLEGLVAHGVSPNKASAATQTEEQQSHRTRSSVGECCLKSFQVHAHHIHTLYSHTHTLFHCLPFSFTCFHPPSAAKLQALDESYAHKAAEESIKCHQALEERMTVFQRECEVRYQRQLKTEMAHFRERELAQARCEERERWREEVGRERKELQETHRRKMEAMRRMELETLERLRRKEQVK